MKLARIRELVSELERHRSYFAPDLTPLPTEEGSIFSETRCAWCKTLSTHTDDCVVYELLVLTGTLDKVRAFGRPIQRYCFYCKRTTRFWYCENCSYYFCTEHAYWDEGDGWEYNYAGKHPVHAL